MRFGSPKLGVGGGSDCYFSSIQFRDKMQHFRVGFSQLRAERVGLVCLVASLWLGGCTPEKRAILRLTAMGFRDQAIAAIDSVRGIYQLRGLSRSPEEARSILVNRLLQSSINVADVRQLDRLIQRSLNPSVQPRMTAVDAALNDLATEYDTAAAIFNDLDRINLGSRDAVSRAAKPARSLTVKMLLLAKLISQSPPTPNDPERVAISVRLDQLRQQYANPRTSDADRQSIKNQVDRLIQQWVAVNTQERQAICDALAKIVQAAETGQKLSQLIDEFGQVRIEDALSRITQVLETTSSLTGRDYSAISTRLQSVSNAVESDRTLQAIQQEILSQSSQTNWSAVSQPAPETSLLNCQP